MKKNTKKNKRGGAMSGGKGKVSRYTQKFKQSYNRFMKIGDNDDDNSKLKKMEEWGRMRGIYKFLKFQNHKYTGDNGEEKTALEKMEENINKTPNNTGYKNAISCFQQNENDILSGQGESNKCIPEEDYIKGAGGMETTADESSPPIVENNEAPIEVPTEEEPATPIEEPATTEEEPTTTTEEEPTKEEPTTTTEEEPTKEEPTDTTAEETPPVIAEEPTEEETPPVIAEVPTDTTTTAPDTDTTEAAEVPEAATDTGDETTDLTSPVVGDNNANNETQEGGRSKRRPRSSRRRAKSMKSKKGRATRRKHRASRH